MKKPYFFKKYSSRGVIRVSGAPYCASQIRDAPRKPLDDLQWIESGNRAWLRALKKDFFLINLGWNIFENVAADRRH